MGRRQRTIPASFDRRLSPTHSQKQRQPQANNMSVVETENDEYIDIESIEYKKQFLHEATKLAIESVEKGWGGPFGAVIVRNGEIIGRGQNRVLLTGIPVYHAGVTAIIDACSRINSKEILGSDYYEGNLRMIPRPRIRCRSGRRCSRVAISSLMARRVRCV
jgi:hypothetical protein